MKVRKKDPPQVHSIGRRDGKYLLYDSYLAALGDQKTEKSFLAHISRLTKADGDNNKKWTSPDPLGSELLRQIFQINDSLSLVITGHLFIESFINHIIERKFKLSYLILDNRDFTFSLKLEILKSKNYLTDSIYFDIKNMNQLRNRFAHNLLYDLSDFDMSKFYYFDQAYKLVKYSSKPARRALNVYILRHVFKEILYRLTIRHPTIAYLNFRT